MTMKAGRRKKCSESFLIYIFFPQPACDLRFLFHVRFHHPQPIAVLFPSTAAMALQGAHRSSQSSTRTGNSDISTGSSKLNCVIAMNYL